MEEESSPSAFAISLILHGEDLHPILQAFLYSLSEMCMKTDCASYVILIHMRIQVKLVVLPILTGIHFVRAARRSSGLVSESPQHAKGVDLFIT